METPQLKRNGTWWQNRSRLERRLSLCATVAVIVACGFAIVMAAMIYSGPDSSKVSHVEYAEALTAINNCEGRGSVCNTPECVLAAAELIENMDKNVDPCEDFYSFACGGFEAKTAIPEHQSSVDTTTLIRDQVTTQLRFLMEQPIKEDDAEHFKLVKQLYQSCLNKTRVEELGLEPLKKILEQFGGWPVIEGDKWNETNFVWHEMIYKFKRAGYSINYLFSFYISTDLKNTNTSVIELFRTTYSFSMLNKGLESAEAKNYLEYQIGLAKLLGADEESARIQQTQVLEFEMLLAKISWTPQETRDANKFYNPMTIAELGEKFPGIPWLEYVNTMLAPHHVLTEDERVNVQTPDYFPKLIDLLAKTPKRTLANYLMWKVSADSLDYLNEAAKNLKLKYEVSFTGMAEHEPRWKECIYFVTSSSLRFAVDIMYVRNNFDEDVRQSATEIFDDIRGAFTDMIDGAEWMDNKTKIQARKKTNSIKANIAYPDELLDDKKLTKHYESLALSSSDYFGNNLKLKTFNRDNDIKTFRYPVHKTHWTFWESATTVNAYYSALHNSMEIPAGILQGTFFGKDRPAYLNYAAIGWTIGRGIIHGFDEYGLQYDHEGNLVNSVEESTMKNYMERAQCITEQYGNYIDPQIGLNLNGNNTRRANIADNGGMKEAYRAYMKWVSRQKNRSENWDQVEQRLPGLSEYNVRQLFWLGAANRWCEKSRTEFLKFRTMSFSLSTHRFRVLGTFANMPQFASDYNCPVGSTMNPVRKCNVW